MNDLAPPPAAPLPGDLTICDREPIHVPGHIQPHGVLIATAPGSRLISHISDNFESLFAAEPESFLNADLENLVGPVACAAIEKVLAQTRRMPWLRSGCGPPGAAPR